LDALADALAQLVALLDARLPPAPAEDIAAGTLDDAAFAAAAAALLKLIEAADGAAPAALRTLRPDLTTRFGLESTAKITNAMQHYDYDEALAILRHLLDPRRSPQTGAQP
ncbi:hypothetical protein, partial [Zoogloea sp.]|uniref:hypothetical protein n=1 Tax=Zoogloea sp. TaxID=49181 RepID=UPI0035B0F8AC